MFASMTYDAKDSSVKVYFLNTTDKNDVKNPKKAYFLNKDRNFFALSPEDTKGINRIIERFARQLIRQGMKEVTGRK
jgi:hypothetical protein